MSRLGSTTLCLLTALASGCAKDEPTWQLVERHLPSALISVWGTDATDVWTVGSDKGGGAGPTVRHFDGATWTSLSTGLAEGDLWWVFGFAGGPVYMGGSGGVILRHQDGVFTRMTTPGSATPGSATPSSDTVFGIWGASPGEVWAVGGALGGAGGAFVWRLVTGAEGEAWVRVPGLPADLVAGEVLWKIWGRAADDVWMVGTSGRVVRWDGLALAAGSVGARESLFTVHGSGERFVAVGGFGTGSIFENDGAGWSNVSPAGASPLVGVCLSPGGGGVAVGQLGAIYQRGAGGWSPEPTSFSLDETLHSAWVDPAGDVWAVGGDVVTLPLSNGVLIHKGRAVPPGAT